MADTKELKRAQDIPCGYNEEYDCDVVVVGCGFSGLNAAVSAKTAGADVLVIDKGKPGFSGLTPYVASFRWFDSERGDEAEAFRYVVQHGGEYMNNMNWYERWLQESKETYLRLKDWGILDQYTRAKDTESYYRDKDFAGYRAEFDKHDRHKKWCRILKDNDIKWLERTMVIDMVTQEGRAIGVVAMHIQSGKFIRVNAKSVIMATGGGCYKPGGYPVGGDTFDGEYIAYNLGLKITGKEFEDFHGTSTTGIGNPFVNNCWVYLENIWLCGGDMSMKNAEKYAARKGMAMVVDRVNKAVYGMPPSDGKEFRGDGSATTMLSGGSPNYGKDPEELRMGNIGSPAGRDIIPGVAIGLGNHLSCGVFNGFNDMDCATSIPGLYVVGDGTHATVPAGAAYPCGIGFTSCFVSIDGTHAGKAAAGYIKDKQPSVIPDDEFIRIKEEACEPLNREKGVDPNWASDALLAIMAPYWVSISKSEPMLRAALSQVEYMRDRVLDKLIARNSHDLKCCIEMKHKILSAEMKLRAGLERKESRGNHYREDYPFRDDENFLCYILAQQAEDGTMKVERAELPEEFKGDTGEEYTKRYLYLYPGEAEAKGITLSRESSDGKGGSR